MYIVTFGGVDHVDGGFGHDRICVGAGLEFAVEGGRGRDRINAGEGWDDVSGGPGRDVLVGGRGADTLRGGPAADVLMGGQGDDELGAYNDRGRDSAHGGPDEDTLYPFGRDVLDGGAGRDGLAFSVSKHVRVDLGAGIAKAHGMAALRKIEGVRGTDLDDILIGDGKENFFIPVYGDDAIDGAGGRDIVLFDRFEDDIDTGLTIDLVAGTATGAGTDTLEGIEDVVGSEGPDVIRGDSGPNRLFGFYDIDTLEGGDGDDVLDGDLEGSRNRYEKKESADGGSGTDRCIDVEERISCELGR
jgi:Ca2+-binding RTX toxin-like protein